jgi:putative transcription factor
MCGKETTLVKALIEGTELNVCSECAKFGKVIKQAPKPIEHQQKKTFQPSTPARPQSLSPQVQVIVENFGEIVKKKREQLGLKQEELAKKIAEKESLIQKIESGHFTPSIRLARKLEKFLKIKLVEQFEEKKVSPGTGESEGLTIGDMLNK